MAKKYNGFTQDEVLVDTSKAKANSSKTAKPSLTRIGTKKTATKESKKADVSKSAKVSKVDVKELEKLNNERLTRHSFRSRRNRVVIVILILLLLASVGGFSAYFFINRLDNNCFVTINGAPNAVCFVDGKELMKFKTPLGVKGNRTYEAKVEIETHEEGTYNIEYEVICYQGKDVLENNGINYNNTAFKEYADGRYRSKTSYTGNVRVDLFYCVYLSEEYENTLTYNNFRMEINIYVVSV